MLLLCHPDHERHKEAFDVAYNALERDCLDVELVLRIERSPLPLLRFIFKEFGSERSRRR
jgi:hypothetical protein